MKRNDDIVYPEYLDHTAPTLARSSDNQSSNSACPGLGRRLLGSDHGRCSKEAHCAVVRHLACNDVERLTYKLYTFKLLLRRLLILQIAVPAIYSFKCANH